MDSQSAGYGAPIQQYFATSPATPVGGYFGPPETYGPPRGYPVSQQYPPSSQQTYEYPQEQYPSPLYQQLDAEAEYGGAGTPVRPPRNEKLQTVPPVSNFSSPPNRFTSPQRKQEQNWQSYGDYGDMTDFGSNFNQTYNTSSDNSLNSAPSQESYLENNGPSTYSQDYGQEYGEEYSHEYGQDYGLDYGLEYRQEYGRSFAQRGRGYSSRDDARERGGRGTFRGQQGGKDGYRGRGMARGNFDSGEGFSRGGMWRGTLGRGRGSFDGTRGRGQSNGMRGRAGQQDGYRGRGLNGGMRGRGQQDGYRGRGLNGGMRGRGQQDGMRGRGRGNGRGFVQGYNIDWKNFNKTGKTKQQSYKVALEGDINFISYKNSLQEYCQKLHKPVPHYTVSKVDVGYSATVLVDGTTYSCQTSQRERKFAELGAAFEALKGIGLIEATATFSAKGKKRSAPPNELTSPKSKISKSESESELSCSLVPSISFKSKLNELCQKMKSELPSYSCVRVSGGFICTVVLNGQVYESAKPFGTKKLAEQNAAEVVLGQIDLTTATTTAGDPTVTTETSNAVITPITNASTTDSNTTTLPSGVDVANTPSNEPRAGQPAVVQKSNKNIIQEYCQKNGIAIPTYTTVKDSGMSISTVNVNGKEFVGTPHIMKKTAEQNAAKKAIEEMGLK